MPILYIMFSQGYYYYILYYDDSFHMNSYESFATIAITYSFVCATLR